MKRMSTTIMLLQASLIVISVVLGWYVIAAELRKPYIIPTPYAVGHELFSSPLLYIENTLTTCIEAVSGLLLSIVTSFVLTLAMYFYAPCQRVVLPLSIIVKATPVVAIAPIVAIWFGPGQVTKVLMSTLVSFFPILQSTHDGLREVPDGPRSYVAVLGTTRFRDLRYVRTWFAIRPFASALKVAAPLAVVGALVAEFVQPTAGLGTLLVRHIPSADTDVIFAAIACVATIGLSMYWVAVELENRLLSMAHLERNELDNNG